MLPRLIKPLLMLPRKTHRFLHYQFSGCLYRAITQTVGHSQSTRQDVRPFFYFHHKSTPRHTIALTTDANSDRGFFHFKDCAVSISDNTNTSSAVFRISHQYQSSHCKDINSNSIKSPPLTTQRYLNCHSLLSGSSKSNIIINRAVCSGNSNSGSGSKIGVSEDQRRFFHSGINSGIGGIGTQDSNSNSNMATGNTSSPSTSACVSGARQNSTLVEVEMPPVFEVAMMNNAKDIFEKAVASVLPKEMVAKHLIFGDTDGDVITVKDKTYHLNHNVYVVGFGKAVLGMARALDDLIGGHIVRGVVSVPQGTQEEFRNAGKTEMLLGPDSSIEVREGALNNMPDPPAHEAALEIADLARSVGEGDLLVVLISGGGSALLPAPTPPITLGDMLSVTGQMSRGGATISQLNTVRKQLDFLKGGGLAQLAHPAQVVSLIISDIVGDPLDLIASAPTVLDNSLPKHCLSLFSQLNIADNIPETVTDFLKEKSKLASLAGNSSASVSENAPRKFVDLSHVQNMIIGSNKIACERACQESNKLGYSPFVLSTELEGEAKEVGRMFAHLALFIALHNNLEDGNDKASMNDITNNIKKIRNRLISSYDFTDSKLEEIIRHVDNSKMASKGVCIVAGGETTVTVTGTGKGGRNQEMATSAGFELDNLFKGTFTQTSDTNYDNSASAASRKKESADDSDNNIKSSNRNPNPITPQVVFLSAGTDGQDGPTSAAGGVVGVNFVRGANCAGLNPKIYLDNNDSFNLLDKWAAGCGLVNTGLTGTNVMDLQLLMVKFK